MTGYLPRFVKLLPASTREFPSVTLIIPFLNNEKILGRCLPSMLATEYGKLSFILIYNPSNDKTLNVLRNIVGAAKKPYRLIVNDQLLSPTGNFNEAMKLTSSDFIVGADSDIEINDPLWLNKLLSIAQRLPNLGAICPCLLNEDGSVQTSGGLKVPFTFEVRKFLPKVENSVSEIHEVHGAFFLCRREVVENVGGFWKNNDINNPYGGDIEFSIRLRRKGYKLYSTNFVTAYHIRGGTLGRNTQRFAKLNYAAFLKINSTNIHNKFFLVIYNMISLHIMKWRLLRARIIGN